MDGNTKTRPAVLRALGTQDPPQQIRTDGAFYEMAELYKHDSWAATARYRLISSTTEDAHTDSAADEIVCKFNRIEPIFGLPTAWLGRLLASRESNAYHTFRDVEGVSDGLGDIWVDDQIAPNAVAHKFIAGHPLGSDEQTGEQFFTQLHELIVAIHQKGFAFVDLHKRENILVGDDGKPYLTDFQISFQTRNGRLWHVPPGKWLLGIFQKSDLFCLSKHIRKLRPQALKALGLERFEQPPWWIRAHRLVAVPFRQTRRKLLSWLRVRDASGRSSSEAFAEHAFRCEQEKQPQRAA